MKIGIDGRAFTGHMTGTGRYVLELMRGLDTLLPDATFVLYLRHAPAVERPSSRWIFRVDTTLQRHLPGPSWSRFALPGMIKKDHIDVFWAAAAIMPCKLRIPAVMTVFDLTHVEYPASMPIATRWGHRWWFASSLREARRRVAISQGTAQRVRDTYGIVCEDVVTPVLGPVFGLPMPARDTSAPPYVLSVATREPRKNLTSLLLAMERINADADEPIELWLAGSTGWGKGVSPEVTRVLNAPWCRVLGYVADADLPALYVNARVFAFPSIYEGYGIPVAEAVACGTPVVATDIPELREAAGDDAIFVGTSSQSIEDGLRIALQTPRTGTPKPLLRDTWEGGRRIAAQLSAVLKG